MTPLLSAITEREEIVLLLLADGHSYREIAGQMAVSPWTVKAHRDNARRKLGASSTVHAVAIVLRARAAAR